MVKGLVQPVEDNEGIEEAAWRARLKEAAEAGIRRDARRQEFVRGANRPGPR
jgi:hypothetical protein